VVAFRQFHRYPSPARKKAAPEDAAKFREETSCEAA
jgi:hypothetical protein